MQVTIIGAGNMARGIATRALVGGHSVRIVDRDGSKAASVADDLRAQAPGGADVAPGDGVEGADVVVLAVPHPAGREILAQYGAALDGKAVVDISNPVDLSTFDSLTVAPGTSAAEELAAAAPNVRIVKAFNTTFATTLATGEVGGTTLDVFVASDDDAAKETVRELVASGGMRAVDAGRLRRARELEAMQFLHMTLQQTLGTDWSSALKILP